MARGDRRGGGGEKIKKILLACKSQKLLQMCKSGFANKIVDLTFDIL